MTPTRSVLTVSALLLAMTGILHAADDSPTYTDPADAGPDFAVQGEYVATLDTDKGPVKIAAQVIALGKGKFQGVVYVGGLPGDGWDMSEPLSADGETKSGRTVFYKDDGEVGAVLKDGKIRAVSKDKEKSIVLKKVARVSPTMGAKPPKGALVLFDGSNTDRLETGRITPDGLLADAVTSKRLFGDHTIHLEFRPPFKPEARGQARGNSGFYVQGRYEVQILDSFGLEGLDNECGGIYKVSRPDVNMCLPPLSWQTYDIDFTAAKLKGKKKTANARITVRHNGVVIHDDLELPGPTPGARLKQEDGAPGPVFLQNHGNPVVFRNIWVVEKN